MHINKNAAQIFRDQSTLILKEVKHIKQYKYL